MFKIATIGLPEIKNDQITNELKELITVCTKNQSQISPQSLFSLPLFQPFSSLLNYKYIIENINNNNSDIFITSYETK